MPLFILLAYRPIAAPKSDGEFTESAYCFTLSNPKTTSFMLPSLSGTQIETTRPPKFVIATSIPLLFFSWNSFTGFSFIVVSNSASSNPDTFFWIFSFCEHDAKSKVANPIKVNSFFVVFILWLYLSYYYFAFKVTKKSYNKYKK